MSTKDIRIQQKVDSLANWVKNNPILLKNEIGYEEETGKFKIGDENTPWIDLKTEENSKGFKIIKVGSEGFYYIDCKCPAALQTSIKEYDELFVKTNRTRVLTVVETTFTDNTYPNEGLGTLRVYVAETDASNISPLETDADDLENGVIENYFTVIGKPELGAITVNYFAKTEGENTIAQGRAAHAEGRKTIAHGNYSHAEGLRSESAIGAHAEGYDTKALGDQSHAEGNGAQAKGYISHAEGWKTKAEGGYAHAENNQTLAIGVASHAEGTSTTAEGDHSHAEGSGAIAGYIAHAEGSQSQAIGNISHAENDGSKATGWASHAEGYQSVAAGNVAHAEGSRTEASGAHSHAEGNISTATGENSHAEGLNNNANGKNSHAEGMNNVVSGENSHVEGSSNNVSGNNSHVGGNNNIVTADDSIVEGSNNIIGGNQYALQASAASDNELQVQLTPFSVIPSYLTNSYTRFAISYKTQLGDSTPWKFLGYAFCKAAYDYSSYKIGLFCFMYQTIDFEKDISGSIYITFAELDGGIKITDNIGRNSNTSGSDNLHIGSYGTTFGKNNNNYGYGNLVIGEQQCTWGNNGLYIGNTPKNIPPIGQPAICINNNMEIDQDGSIYLDNQNIAIIGGLTDIATGGYGNKGSQSLAIGGCTRIDRDGIAATAIGTYSSASSMGTVALGAGAHADAQYAVQLGTGTNNNEYSLQFRDWQLINKNGKIPEDRLPSGLQSYYCNYDSNIFAELVAEEKFLLYTFPKEANHLEVMIYGDFAFSPMIIEKNKQSSIFAEQSNNTHYAKFYFDGLHLYGLRITNSLSWSGILKLTPLETYTLSPNSIEIIETSSWDAILPTLTFTAPSNISQCNKSNCLFYREATAEEGAFLRIDAMYFDSRLVFDDNTSFRVIGTDNNGTTIVDTIADSTNELNKTNRRIINMSIKNSTNNTYPTRLYIFSNVSSTETQYRNLFNEFYPTYSRLYFSDAARNTAGRVVISVRNSTTSSAGLQNQINNYQNFII